MIFYSRVWQWMESRVLCHVCNGGTPWSLLIRENPNCTILPLDSRNQESVQKSSPTRDWAFVTTELYFLLPVMWIILQVLTTSCGMIVLWLNRVYLETRELNPWSSIFDQRKSQLYHFTIGFQKPGICADSWFLESNGKMVQLGCADSWFLESNGKMVQLGFSLIKNRASHGAGLLWPPGYTFYSRSCSSTCKFWQSHLSSVASSSQISLSSVASSGLCDSVSLSVLTHCRPWFPTGMLFIIKS
jgi:hypothetical protein